AAYGIRDEPNRLPYRDANAVTRTSTVTAIAARGPHASWTTVEATYCACGVGTPCASSKLCHGIALNTPTCKQIYSSATTSTERTTASGIVRAGRSTSSPTSAAVLYPR